MQLWRAIFAQGTDADDAGALLAVRGPTGRFHHDGHPTIYASCSPKGTRIALGRYLRDDDPPRVIVPLRLTNGRLADLTAPDAAGIIAPYALEDLSQRWEATVAAGQIPTTWAIADKLRLAGYHGLLYASRAQPSLTHVALWSWNTPGAPVLSVDGEALPF